MYKALLILHVLSGALCLTSGALAIFSRKGGKLHTRSGKVFYGSMYAVGISAFVMTLIKFNPFLLSIAVFSVYLSFSGRKAIMYWRLRQHYTPTFMDKLPCYVAMLTALFMISYPISLMVRSNTFFVPVLAVFGLILLTMAIRDIRVYATPAKFVPRNKEWLFMHIGKMSGAFIATFTAFLLNNVHVEPFWLPWLGPTAIGTPLIFYSIRRWNTMLSKGKQPTTTSH